MKKKVILLLFFCLLLYSSASFFRDLFLPDEPRDILVAQSIQSSTSIFIPTLAGKNYYEKPPFYFWMISFFSHWGIKGLPWIIAVNTAFAFFMAFALYVFVRRFGSEERALYATAILLTLLIFYAMTVIIRMDIVFVFFLTAGLFLFYQSLVQDRYGLCVASGILSFLACFTKGAFGFFIPFVTELFFILSGPNKKKYCTYFFIANFSALFLIGVWIFSVSVFIQPDYAQQMLFRQSLARGIAPSSHAQPFFFYVLVFVPSFFPWGVLSLGRLIRIVRQGTNSAFERFCSIWLIAGFIFLSLVKSKLVMYLLVLSVPVSVLATMELLGFYRWHKYYFIFLLALFSLLFLGAGIYFFFCPSSLFGQNDFLTFLMVGCFCLFLFLKRKAETRKLFWMVFLGWVVILLSANFILQPAISYHKGLRQIVDFLKEKNVFYEAFYIDKAVLRYLSLYDTSTPLYFFQPDFIPDKSLSYVIISQYNRRYPLQFLGKVSKYYLWHNVPEG